MHGNARDGRPCLRSASLAGVISVGLALDVGCGTDAFLTLSADLPRLPAIGIDCQSLT